MGRDGVGWGDGDFTGLTPLRRKYVLIFVSHPILDPTLRVGRFLLSDVLRSFEGAGQWLVRNITLTTRMTEPLLGEIMGDLMKVKAARFSFDQNSGHVIYEPLPKKPAIR